MGLLKGIDPLLSADLLWVLRSMGHGDTICICDCNFPAYEVSTHTTSRKLISLPVPLPEATGAILSVLPLDFFVRSAAHIMAPSSGVALPQAGKEVKLETLRVMGHHPETVADLERFQFYEKARTCFAVVQTAERRPYGNIILQKGVIGYDGNDLKPQSS